MANPVVSSFQDIVKDLEIRVQETEGLDVAGDEDLKKLRKKLKKYVVEPKEASLPDALDKVGKLVDLLFKHYESAAKNRSQMVISKENRDSQSNELAKVVQQKSMFDNLHANFMKKYNDEVKAAQDFENEGQQKKAKTIEELQARVKAVQDKYEETGKIRIDKYKDNQIAKEELQRLEPHIATSQALMDAQFKKKSIEIEIEMASLKQKIEVIENYKVIGAETKKKLEKSIEQEGKIAKKLGILEGKEEEHKIALTKAHLVIDQYKKVMMSIHEIWDKSQKEAVSLKQKLLKSQEALKTQTNEEANLKRQLQTQKAQLEGLKTLEKTLAEQLKQL